MITLKLLKGYAYYGEISATAADPYVTVEDEAIAERAVASGYFEIAAGKPEAEAATVTPAYSGKTLEEMTVSELETFATYKGIKLKNARSKSAILAKLRAELPEEELIGDIEYGSPTIVELQEE